MKDFCGAKIRVVNNCFCSGYNPPQFVTDAAKEALNRVECNQYSPTKVYNSSRIDCPYFIRSQ